MGIEKALANPGIDVVLFDVGGVLASDVIETVLLTPSAGLCDRLHLSDSLAGRVATAYTSAHDKTQTGTEAGFWSALEAGLKITIPAALRTELKHLIVPNPDARSLIAAAAGAGKRVGIISDNYRFLLYLQLNAEPAIVSATEPSIRYFSQEQGAVKSDGSLFGVVARQLRPARTLIVDDRAHNIAVARNHGFKAIEYGMMQPWRVAGRSFSAAPSRGEVA